MSTRFRKEKRDPQEKKTRNLKSSPRTWRPWLTAETRCFILVPAADLSFQRDNFDWIVRFLFLFCFLKLTTRTETSDLVTRKPVKRGLISWDAHACARQHRGELQRLRPGWQARNKERANFLHPLSGIFEKINNTNYALIIKKKKRQSILKVSGHQ